MSKYDFVGNHIELTKIPTKFKKCTATRFATILGLNAWNTPFSAWCEITKTYEDPFVESKYTLAGKVIEPKVIDYLNNVMFMDIKSPSDVYGADYFKKTWGDFFPEVEALGGMWDALGEDFVVEIKTTKRAEDWAEDVPIYYKLQACLYAYLLGFDNVVVTASFLAEKDYEDPDAFIPSFENTKIYEFKLSEAFPNFEEAYIVPALEFWKTHVLTGISPEFDEKKDAEILKALRKNTVEPAEDEINALIKEADKIQECIEIAEARLEDKRKRLKEIDDTVKKYMSGKFRDGDKKVEIAGNKYTWTLSKSERSSVDSTRLKKEKPDVFAEYSKKTEVLSLKKSLIEEV